MKIDFNLSSLLGTVYRKGNLLFSPDGNCLLSPVGNRLSVFDLPNNKSYTLPFAHRRNISCVALNALGNVALSVDEDGKAILSSLPRRLALYHFSFSGPTSCIVFSPSARYLAAAVGRMVEIWQVPEFNLTTGEEGLAFAPLVQYRILAGHDGLVQHLAWSGDGRFLLSCGTDLIARMWSLDPTEGFVPTTLMGHRESLVGAWFSADQEKVFTLSQDGALFEWKYGSDDAQADDDFAGSRPQQKERWHISQRHYFHQQHAKAKCSSFHPGSSLLVVGFSNGVFCLHELPDFVMIHTLSISKSDLDVVVFNNSAEWLAFGSSRLGQLLVWEWQSESYVLKQQGHFDAITDVSYSSNGQRVVTTSEDGKIKVWDSQSGFCTVTFSEHSSSVTACQFTQKGSLLFTSSLDGSVRAWDLIRYRNFRTFVAPTRVSFSCVAVDASNEVACAGSIDSFDIYVWSVQTGQLLDQLSGHTGPVRTLAFAPTGDRLLSGSWDHTVRLWSIFSRSQTSEPVTLQTDVLAVAFRPDSRQIAISTLDGQLSFWSVDEATQLAAVDGRRDIAGGRKITDRMTAAHSAETKYFTHIEYSADGSCVLAGGVSKFICLYDVLSGVLLKKFVVSANLSLDGTQDFLNSRLLTEAGPRDLIDERGDSNDLVDRMDQTIPGYGKGDASLRQVRAGVKVTGLAFSPTGNSFCAASTEGLLIYSTESTVQFDPFDLDLEVTPTSIVQAVQKQDYLRALVSAFRLNELPMMRRVYEAVPENSIAIVMKELPVVYLGRFMTLMITVAEESPRLELNLRWMQSFLRIHGSFIKSNPTALSSELRAFQKVVRKCQNELASLASDNLYTLDYILTRAHNGSNATLMMEA